MDYLYMYCMCSVPPKKKDNFLGKKERERKLSVSKWVLLIIKYTKRRPYLTKINQTKIYLS